MEPMRISETSPHRGDLADLAMELAAHSTGFRRSLPEGVLAALADLVRAMKDRGYLTVVLRDCTTAVETRQSYGDLWTTKWAIQEIERFHFTSLSEDFIQACSPEDRG